jgi:predicted deacylase
LQIGMEGALRVLAELGLQQCPLLPAPPGIACASTRWVRAKVAGIYRSRVQIGQLVQKGQVIGSIAGPYGEMAIRIKSPFTGYIIGLNHMAVVNQGDALANVGIA